MSSGSSANDEFNADAATAAAALCRRRHHGDPARDGRRRIPGQIADGVSDRESAEERGVHGIHDDDPRRQVTVGGVRRRRTGVCVG